MMCKNKSILVLIFILPVIFLSAQKETDMEPHQWAFIEMNTLGCQVNAPGKMDKKEVAIPTEIGNIIQEVRLWKDDKSSTENYLYSLTTYEYPAGTFHPDSTDLVSALFEEVIQSSTESFEGEILYSDPRFEWGHPAHIWKMRFNNDRAFVKSKMVLVNNRCYFLQVFMLDRYQKNKNADRFLNSFKLI